MENINLRTVGSMGIGGQGFKVSTTRYSEEEHSINTNLYFQAVKQVNGSRTEERNFKAAVPVYHLLDLLEKYMEQPGGAARLVGQQPRLEAMIAKMGEAMAKNEAEQKALKDALGSARLEVLS